MARRTLLDADKHQHKVRLAGIDAPESGQAFGRRSKQTLSDCAFGKQATLIGDKVDRYGRTVAKVMVSGVDCNLRQVMLGLAWHYKAYEREQSAPDRDAYANAERDARKARSGLWADAKPVPPWEWRNGEGQVRTRARKPRRSPAANATAPPATPVSENEVPSIASPQAAVRNTFSSFQSQGLLKLHFHHHDALRPTRPYDDHAQLRCL